MSFFHLVFPRTMSWLQNSCVWAGTTTPRLQSSPGRQETDVFDVDASCLGTGKSNSVARTASMTDKDLFHTRTVGQGRCSLELHEPAHSPLHTHLTQFSTISVISQLALNLHSQEMLVNSMISTPACFIDFILKCNNFRPILICL